MLCAGSLLTGATTEAAGGEGAPREEGGGGSGSGETSVDRRPDLLLM